ncbi:protein trichome birefringence-like 42 isoform X2 [Rhododendron vialii]|uniref:protein trichome birefringence-like 42 isoform X2 n=1 Tax=Rhododendron vialii TaxID=182163 RepID=UPI00265D6577|nr:protein trichome birefringence-like 42 isoform X2 [Rhododendron vialii]
MDKGSSIDKKWKLCAFASFIGCVILTLYLNNHQNSIRLISFRNISVSVMSSEPFKPLVFVEKEIPMKTDASLVVKNKEPSVFVEKEIPMKTDASLLVKNKEERKSNIAGSCNIFDGRWIYKPADNPLYDEFQCPFLSDQVSCQRNGRPDFDYKSWSWEAKDCEIPRFDGKDLLERLRGKRMVIVGDSLNRNQWESLACLLYSVISPSRAHVEVQSGVYKVFRAKDYNCSVEFHWSPFLVQFDTKQAKDTKALLRLDKLETSARQWRGANIMVFNTGHWWVQTGKFRKWDLFQYRGKLIQEMDIESAFEMAMKTWAQWIDQNVESNKTNVFFRSISPEHKGNHRCQNVTQPIMNESYKASFPKPVIDIVERIIGGMRTPVTYLNITKLSEYRRDAHPTVYAKKKMMIEKEGKQLAAFADCSHWCLPGVPDTWNRLFYALLVFNTSTKNLNSSHEGL